MKHETFTPTETDVKNTLDISLLNQSVHKWNYVTRLFDQFWKKCRSEKLSTVLKYIFWSFMISFNFINLAVSDYSDSKILKNGLKEIGEIRGRLVYQ